MRSRALSLAVLLAAGATPSLAAQDSWTAAKTLLRQADSLLGQENSVSAEMVIVYARRALRLIGQPAPAERWRMGRPYVFMAQAFQQLGQPDSMLFYERAALPYLRSGGDPEALGLLYRDVARLHLNAGRADSALANLRRYLAQIRQARGPDAGADASLWMGIAYETLRMRDSAVASFHRSIALARKSKDPFIEASATRMLGRYHLSGALGAGGDSALIYFRTALAIHTQARIPKGLPSLMGDMAEVFRVSGVLDSALKYGYAGLLLNERLTREDGERIILLLQVAKTWAEAGELLHIDSSRRYAGEALALIRSTGQQQHLADALSHLGATLIRVRRDSAASLLREALAAYGAQSNRDGELKAHLFLGWALLGTSGDSALAHLTTARDGLLASHSGNAAQAQFGVASARFVQGRFDLAARDMADAFAMRAGRRRTAGSDFLRIATGDYNARIYDELWTRAWLNQAPTIGDQSALLGALAAADRVRAQALLDLMETADPDSGAAEDYPARGRRLLDRARGSADLVLYYRNAADTVFIWSQDKSGPPVLTRVPVPQDTLAETIAAYLGALGLRGGTRMLRSRVAELERGTPTAVAPSESMADRHGNRLAAWLLPGGLHEQLLRARHVLIIPQGLMSSMPFAALPDPAGKGPLGTTRALRFAPSLGSLEGAERRPASWTSPAELSARSLVVGNPLMPMVTVSDGSRQILSSLPGAEVESRQVAQRVGATPLIGPEATETAVRRKLGSAALVHLATHGFAYSAVGDAGSSFIALGSDPAGDGLLTVSEVVNDPDLKLRADLVVLSACQTGLGSLRDAEGTVGLQRAFLGRGARSVMVSLWNVSDAATRLLMDRFYQHWLDPKNRLGKAEALRQAQEDVRKTRGYEHPRFWAAFQLVGAN